MKESKSYSGIWSFLTVVFVSLGLFSYGTAMMDYVLIYPSRLISAKMNSSVIMHSWKNGS
ncbi:MAG TPA: hypothetical protein VK625_05095 [Flavitalea sp.]|nr:hypothetical protein [Flavitalea sp.]